MKIPLLNVCLAASLVQLAPAATNAPAPAEGVTVETSTRPLPSAETPAQRDARMAWWREAKFGLFLHWGVYSVPAGKYGSQTNYAEWIMNSARIPVPEYQAYARQFNPVKYDPAGWVKTAQDAGMRYIVITAKHHDGFAMFPSAASHWNVVDATPYGQDLVGPLVQAAHDQGMKIGCYYSQSQDWNNPGGAKSGFPEGDGWDPLHKGNYDAYLNQVAVQQVRELLTRYPLDILWWDTPLYMSPKRIAPLAALVKLRPGLITNNRLGGGFGGDTATPEQFVPVTGYPGDWETCMTMNDHWGYNAYDQNWKTSAELIRKLAEICAKGGNFLLNIGPTSAGEFPPASLARLHDIGQWLRVNGDSIYGTSRGPFAYLPWGVATRKGSRLYLHIFQWPKDGRLLVPLANQVTFAALLARPGSTLPVAARAGRVELTLPADAPDPADSVVTLEIKGAPVLQPVPSAGALAQASAWQPGSEPANALDGSGQKCWRAPRNVQSAWLEVDLGQPVAIGAFGLDEPDVWPRLHQTYTLEVADASGWRKIAGGKTQGHGTCQSLPPVTARKFRLTMECPQGSPGVAELQLYRAEE